MDEPEQHDPAAHAGAALYCLILCSMALFDVAVAAACTVGHRWVWAVLFGAIGWWGGIHNAMRFDAHMAAARGGHG